MAALDHYCPSCGQAPDKPCTRYKKVRPLPHVLRVRLSEMAEAKQNAR